jgi:hypothetical protein
LHCDRALTRDGGRSDVSDVDVERAPRHASACSAPASSSISFSTLSRTGLLAGIPDALAHRFIADAKIARDLAGDGLPARTK